MASGIYAYYDNLKDEIVYVGKSNNISNRHRQHMSQPFKHRQAINSILQNNPNRYSLIVLKKCDMALLDNWEMTLIALFNPKFNFTNGGEGMNGFKMPQTAKDKISKALKGVPKSLEHVKKVSEGNKGKKISDEDKLKKSDALKQFYKNPLNRLKKSKEMRKYPFCGNNSYYRKDLVNSEKPKKCFQFTYNWKRLSIGMFHEWTSCDIIAQLIDEILAQEQTKKELI